MQERTLKREAVQVTQCPPFSTSQQHTYCLIMQSHELGTTKPTNQFSRVIFLEKTVCEQRDGYNLQLLLERRAWKYVCLEIFTYNTFLWCAVPVTTNRNNVRFIHDCINW